MSKIYSFDKMVDKLISVASDEGFLDLEDLTDMIEEYGGFDTLINDCIVTNSLFNALSQEPIFSSLDLRKYDWTMDMDGVIKADKLDDPDESVMFIVRDYKTTIDKILCITGIRIDDNGVFPIMGLLREENFTGNDVFKSFPGPEMFHMTESYKMLQDIEDQGGMDELLFAMQNTFDTMQDSLITNVCAGCGKDANTGMGLCYSCMHNTLVDDCFPSA